MRETLEDMRGGRPLHGCSWRKFGAEFLSAFRTAPLSSIFALPHLNSAGEGHPCEQVQQHSAGRNIGAVPEERAKAHSLSTRWFLNKVEQRKSIGTRTRKPRRRGQTSRPRLHTRLGPFQREGFELGFCSVRLRVHDASTQGRMIGGS